VDRRAFISGIAGGLLVAPLAAQAQEAARIARIGFLSLHVVPNHHLLEAFRQGLRDIGYVEGRNVVIAGLRPKGMSRPLEAD